MNIKEWAVEDRPREKLYTHGAKQLTNAELLAIIISSGTKTKSALELAKDLLAASDQSLDQLATKDIKKLCIVKGVGNAKAVAIKAAMELANRRNTTKKLKRKITCSTDSYEEMSLYFMDLQHEEFWAVYLNRANRVISKERISVGGVAGTVVDPKIVFKPAILLLATGVILYHNHPSGNLRPSQMDVVLTEKLVNAGKALDIVIHDHLIIHNKTYFSLRDEGLI